MSVLLQISDPHFGTERPAVVEALVAFAQRERPDLVVLSGDITQRASAEQFRAARAFADRLGAPFVAIPGNHDIPLFDLPARLFRPYARQAAAFGAELEPVHASAELLVVCVNTTRWWRHKNGEVSAAQIARVAARLGAATPAQLRVVVVHQPVAVPRPQDAHDLLRGHADALRQWAQAGADVVMGGHIHLPCVLEQRSLARPLWVVQAGTAVSRRVREGVPNSVNLLRWSGVSGSREAVVEQWDGDAAGGAFARRAVTRMVLARATLNPEDTLVGRLVPFAGQHALPLFFALLVLVLAATGLGWWAFQRWMLPREPGAAPTPVLLLLRLALGFGAIVLGAWVFAEIADELHADAALGAADQALADALHASVPLPALQFFAALTRLANTATLTVLCIAVAVALVVAGRRWLAFGWVAAVAGNSVLNVTLKQVFARGRPLHDDGIVLAQGFSFPSGHSSGAVVTYCMLAYVANRFLPPRWHLPTLLIAVALAFSIGASRMFLRVHFASDVIAGFASGSAWLAVCVASIELTRWYRRRRV